MRRGARRKSRRKPLTVARLAEAEHQNQMLTTTQCARWMGVGSSYIVAEIREGYLIANNLGKFKHRADYRVFFPNFVAYLRAKRWSRIPIDSAELR